MKSCPGWGIICRQASQIFCLIGTLRPTEYVTQPKTHLNLFTLSMVELSVKNCANHYSLFPQVFFF